VSCPPDMALTLTCSRSVLGTLIEGYQGEDSGRISPSPLQPSVPIRLRLVSRCRAIIVIRKVHEVPIKNDQLRAARHRTESPSQPGECLSRQELAELANAYIWDHHQKRVETDGNYLGKLERGVIRWPGRYYREALRAILGVSADSQLGFSNPRRAVLKLAPIEGDQFIHDLDTSPVALSPASSLPGSGEPTPAPARVRATDIEQIHTAAQVFASWDHSYGGGPIRDAVLAQLHSTVGLLKATCPSQLCEQLHSAVGYLAHTCAFIAFDAYAHHDARRIFRFALASAEKVGNWHLRAKILSSMARQAIWTGRPDEGLTYAEHALVRADRLTATEQAMLHTARGRALAKMGRVRDTLIAVGTADDHFAHADPRERSALGWVTTTLPNTRGTPAMLCSTWRCSAARPTKPAGGW